MKYKNKILPITFFLAIALVVLSIYRYLHSPSFQARRLLEEIRQLDADLNPLSDLLEELEIIHSYDSRTTREIFDDIAALDLSAQTILIDALIDILKQDQPNLEKVKTNAALALSNIGAPAAPALLDLLNHPNLQTRLHAARALIHIDQYCQNPDIIQLCIDATKDPDPQIRLQTVLNLYETGMYAQPATPDLIQLLSDNLVVRAKL